MLGSIKLNAHLTKDICQIGHRNCFRYLMLLLLTSYMSVFVGLVIMNVLALFYLLIFNENNILITCWSFTLDR